MLIRRLFHFGTGLRNYYENTGYPEVKDDVGTVDDDVPAVAVDDGVPNVEDVPIPDGPIDSSLDLDPPDSSAEFEDDPDAGEIFFHKLPRDVPDEFKWTEGDDKFRPPMRFRDVPRRRPVGRPGGRGREFDDDRRGGRQGPRPGRGRGRGSGGNWIFHQPRTWFRPANFMIRPPVN